MSSPLYQVRLIVDNAYRERVRSRKLAALLRRALDSEEVPAPCAISVVVTSDAAVRDLNRRFRRQDTATDVLSFGMEDDAGFVAGEGPPHLGEIVISFPTAKRQAREAGHHVDAELEHLLVHGVLHLLGYDHERLRDQTIMRAREEALLGRTAH